MKNSKYINTLFEIIDKLEVSTKTETASFDLIFAKMLKIFADKKDNGKVISIGNGGSGAIASHFTNDLIRNAKVPAICFSDYAVLTCLSNDYGYEQAYKESLRMLAGKDDLLVAISSSGKSPNILNAVLSAKDIGLTVITLSGFLDDNPLRSLGDINIYIPSSFYGMVELSHQIILHMVTDSLNELESFGEREGQID